MTEVPKILLAHHLRTLKLPTFLREGEEAELVEIGAGGGDVPVQGPVADRAGLVRGTTYPFRSLCEAYQAGYGNCPEALMASEKGQGVLLALFLSTCPALKRRRTWPFAWMTWCLRGVVASAAAKVKGWIQGLTGLLPAHCDDDPSSRCLCPS